VGTVIVRTAADEAGPADRTLIIDGRDTGKLARERRVHLDPGSHLLLVEAAGGVSPFTQRFDVAAGASVTLVVPPASVAPARVANRDDARSTTAVAPLPTAPVAASDQGTPRGRTWRVAGIATASAGVVALGVGLLFGLAARSASAEVSHKYDADRDSAGRRDEVLQWVGYGVGLAAIGAGAWMFHHAADMDQPDTDGGHAFRILVGPRGLAAEGTF
jgi:hypothetical protein